MAEFRSGLDRVTTAFDMLLEDSSGSAYRSASSTFLDTWLNVCTQESLFTWNGWVATQSETSEGRSFLKHFLEEYSFEIFDRLAGHMKQLVISPRSDPLVLGNEDLEEHISAIENAFISLSRYCSQKEYYMMTAEFLTREEDSSPMYLATLFLLQTCLITGHAGVGHAGRRQVGRSSLAPALALLLRLLGGSCDEDDNSDADDEEAAEDAAEGAENADTLNSVKLSLVCPPLPLSSRLPCEGTPTLEAYLALARETGAGAGPGAGAGDRSDRLSCAARLPGLLLLLRTLCLGWLRDVQSCDSEHVLQHLEQERESLTSHLLQLLVVIASRCSDFSRRRVLCATATSLLATLNREELIVARPHCSHPYVELPGRSTPSRAAASGGEGVCYLLNHPLRVRHAMMQQALYQVSSAHTHNAYRRNSKSLTPLPFSSSQKRNVELKSEADAAKNSLFRRVWALPVESEHFACESTLEAMLPWSSVIPAAWRKTLRDCRSRSDSSQWSLERSLRLRRDACLHWPLLGVALFAFYVHEAEQKQEQRQGAGNSTGAGEEQYNWSAVSWSVRSMLPVAFLLLTHPQTKSHEGLFCAALLPNLPIYPSSSSLSSPSSSLAPALLLASIPHVPPALVIAESCFISYVSSMLSFDWKEDLLDAYLQGEPSRQLCRQKCAIVGAHQNAFLLCQLVINAIMHTSDRLTQRGSLLLLRWAVFSMHASLASRTGPGGASSGDVPTVSATLLLLRRLVDMCPFPQGKGVLTDMAKDLLKLVSPFRSAELCAPVVSVMTDENNSSSSSSSSIPPPPVLPGSTSGTQGSQDAAATLTRGLDGHVDSSALEFSRELQAVLYSEALDLYLCAHVSAAYTTSSPPLLPLRVVLELFVLPALQKVAALGCRSVQASTRRGNWNEDELDEELSEILENLDWFASALSLVRLAVMKLAHAPALKEGARHALVISDQLTEVSISLVSCREVLERHMERLKTRASNRKRRRGEASIDDCEQGGGQGQDSIGSSNIISDNSDTAAVLRLEMVVMNLADCLSYPSMQIE